MEAERPPDPVDLMLDGKFEEAAGAYAALYAEALKNGDLAIGPDLLMGLQYCVAGTMKKAPAQADVDVSVKQELAKRGVKIGTDVEDHLHIARAMVTKARQRGARSVASVESEKSRLKGE